MHRSLAVASLALLLPSLAAADDASRSWAERARIVAHDDKVRLYGLPTKDTEGNLRYFDVVVTVKIGAAGKPKRAIVESIPSPPIAATSFVPGDYAGAGVTCTLSATQESGQPRFDLLCADDDEPTATPAVRWYAGDFEANPNLEVLQDKGIDAIPGHEGMAWGLVVTEGTFSPFESCLSQDGGIVAAAQAGASVVLTYYGFSNEAECSVAVMLAAP